MAVATGSFQKVSLTASESAWYLVQCVLFGAGYLAKLPAKKAMADFGLADLSRAESFFYLLECCFFGAGYIAKIPVAKALSEVSAYRAARLVNVSRLAPVIEAATLPPRPR